MAKRKTAAESSDANTSSKKLNWYVTAIKNAYLPDGTFVAKGESVKTTSEFVERLRAANDQSFEITQK